MRTTLIAFIFIKPILSLCAMKECKHNDSLRYYNAGVGISGGPGYLFPLGQAGKYFKQASYFGGNAIVYLRKQKLQFMLGGVQSITELKQDIGYNEHCLGGRLVNAEFYEMAVGYTVLDKRYFSLTPVLAGGSVNYEVIKTNSALPYHQSVNYFSCFAKLALDLKFIQFQKGEQGGISLRTLIGYSPMAYQLPYKISGGGAFVSFNFCSKMWIP